MRESIYRSKRENQSMGLEGKVCVVIGASSGIGAGIAEAVAKQKPDHIVLAARRREALNELRNKLHTTYKTDSLIIPTDITDYSQIEKLMQETKDHFGRIDYVVNAAGMIQSETPIEKVTPEYRRQITAANQIQVGDVASIITPYFQQQGHGVYLVISSQAGFPQNAFAGEAEYNATKAAVNQMILSIDNGYAPARKNGSMIYAFAVGPGFINTEEAKRQFPAFAKAIESSPTPLEFGERTIIPYLQNPSKMHEKYGSVRLVDTVKA